ncbi:MAG: sigma-70 family RNA polymerase sigma factor [Saprospiraceae bacterium]|nr:MAG: sigma-70 family RNA polymerase sigma factor [Saprospiraceae bacterium]
MDNDLHLVKETLKGNQVSFRVLVERYRDYVFTISFKVLNNREESEEAAQDAFLKAYRGLARFEQRSKFATWLYQIAWRTAIDRLRARPPKAMSVDEGSIALQLPDAADSPAQQLHRKTIRAFTHQALSCLKPEDAALLTLYYLNEQSVKEITVITGQTESNVKVRLFRLRDAMKNQLMRMLKSEVKEIANG